MNQNYFDNKNILKTFYESAGLGNKFEDECIYLETAFNEIERLWQSNFSQIKTVNFLMIAEAPLWGSSDGKYFYNPQTPFSQFFHSSDLCEILKVPIIKNKLDFLIKCNEIGLLIIDLSPFPLNTDDTSLNYGKTTNISRKLKKSEYRELVSLTIPTYFKGKIKAVKEKKANDMKIFFRYSRVMDTFQDIIYKVLIDNDFILQTNDLLDISQKGGGIDKVKFGQIIKSNRI